MPFPIWLRKPSNSRIVCLLVVLMGIALRLAQYRANRSLWLDEALLALNVVERPWSELFKPLDYNQGAPIGFLFLSKFVITLFGNRDFILRLAPVFFGCLACLLFWLLTQHVLNKPAPLLALALFALNDRLIYYASEFKQYAVDVAICLMLWLGFAWVSKRKTGFVEWLSFGAFGAVGIWFSHPAIFVMAAVATVLGVEALLKKEWARLKNLGWVVFLWGASFSLSYLVSLQHLSANSALLNYWQDNFMPMPPWQDWGWFASTFADWYEEMVGVQPLVLGMALSALGWVFLLIRRWQWGLAIGLPFLITLLASGFHLYPFGQRLSLFLLPGFFLTIAAGSEQIVRLFKRLTPLAVIVWLVLVGIILYAPLISALDHLSQPRKVEEMKPVMGYLAARRREGDLIYLYYNAQFAFRYYAPQYHLDSQNILIGSAWRDAPQNYLPELDALRGNRRVWVVFSHVYHWNGSNEEEFILRYLDTLGNRRLSFRATGASVYLYRMNPSSP